MYSPHKHSYLQSRTQNINPRIINRTVFLARSQPPIDGFDLEPPFLRLTSEQPSIPVQHVDVTRRPVAFGRWALPKLRRELHDPKLSVMIEAITSITDLVHDPEKGYEAITLRIPDRISDLLAHEKPEVRERACMALTVIAGLADGKDAIVKNKAALKNLVKLVEDPLDVLRMKAAVLLEMIARSWMAADYLVEAGFVALLLDYVGREEDPIAELQLDILRWIMYGEGKDIALELGAFDIFVDLMEYGSEVIISKAALCLMMITSTYTGKRIAYSEKILPRLTKLLLREEQQIYTGAASAIMFSTIKSCAKLRAKDIPRLAERLVTLSNDWHNPETQIYCIKALTNISEHPEIRKEMKEKYIEQLNEIIVGNNEDLKRYKETLLTVVNWVPWSNT